MPRRLGTLTIASRLGAFSRLRAARAASSLLRTSPQFTSKLGESLRAAGPAFRGQTGQPLVVPQITSNATEDRDISSTRDKFTCVALLHLATSITVRV